MAKADKGDFYNPTKIEPMWQERWETDGLYESNIDRRLPKHYALTMLPYPSGELHIGHWYAKAPADSRARYKRMRGYNVMFPMGFDAFGLPAENAAIKKNAHPETWTYGNIEQMRKQLRRIGMMIDWRRQIISADRDYFRWTQWFFLQLFRNDFAYRKRAAVDWCPNCNTTLAREQVWGDERLCERCQSPVTKRELEQWFFRTTRYAEELLDFTGLDWPERVKTLQTNWIGRSLGARVVFKTEKGAAIEVFTTRPDTLWGATFMVLAPEHPLVKEIISPEHKDQVDAYIDQAGRQSDLQREATDKEKTGVFTGGYAINPVNREHIPVWIADYVLMSYGTGAIMAVPAHDQRDFEFARKYQIEIRPVIQPDDTTIEPDAMTAAIVADGSMVQSGPLTGTPAGEAIKRTTEHLEEIGAGHSAVNYRLRDWLISRQRYWGTPIPILYCRDCGIVPVPEDQLPVLLPDDVEWKPTGESPLKLHPSWRHTKCPQCQGEAERETDTMDTFMCSSWYHLRYLSPKDTKHPFDAEEYQYWMPVDTYTGGIEHATMHLIYTRFFHKACRDMGILEGPEPMIQLRNQGIILGEDSEKMSKSRGNVVAPDQLIEDYGADIMRAFLMFFARWERGGPWDSQGIEGASRWLHRVWTLFTEKHQETNPDPEIVGLLRRKVHQTLESVTGDFEDFQFNTIISALMELLNEMYKSRELGAAGSPAWGEALDIYLRMLAPVAPHLAEELWHRLGKPYSIHQQSWPQIDEEAAAAVEITLVVQVNGKLRDRIVVAADISEDEARRKALASEVIQPFLEGKQPRKTIVVPGRLVNIVI